MTYNCCVICETLIILSDKFVPLPFDLTVVCCFMPYSPVGFLCSALVVSGMYLNGKGRFSRTFNFTTALVPFSAIVR